MESADILEKVRSELTCGICYELFRLPTALACGHTFCKYCLSPGSLEGCPICRTEVGSANINQALRAILEAVAGVRTTAEARVNRRSLSLHLEKWWARYIGKEYVSTALLCRLLLYTVCDAGEALSNDFVACAVYAGQSRGPVQACVATIHDAFTLCLAANFVPNHNGKSLYGDGDSEGADDSPDGESHGENSPKDDDQKSDDLAPTAGAAPEGEELPDLNYFKSYERIKKWVETLVSKSPSLMVRRKILLGMNVYNDRLHSVASSLRRLGPLPCDVGRHARCALRIEHSSISLCHAQIVELERACESGRPISDPHIWTAEAPLAFVHTCGGRPFCGCGGEGSVLTRLNWDTPNDVVFYPNLLVSKLRVEHRPRWDEVVGVAKQMKFLYSREVVHGGESPRDGGYIGDPPPQRYPFDQINKYLEGTTEHHHTGVTNCGSRALGIIDMNSTIGSGVRAFSVSTLHDGDILQIGDGVEVTVSLVERALLPNHPYANIVYNKALRKCVATHILTPMDVCICGENLTGTLDARKLPGDHLALEETLVSPDDVVYLRGGPGAAASERQSSTPSLASPGGRTARPGTPPTPTRTTLPNAPTGLPTQREMQDTPTLEVLPRICASCGKERLDEAILARKLLGGTDPRPLPSECAHVQHHLKLTFRGETFWVDPRGLWLGRGGVAGPPLAGYRPRKLCVSNDNAYVSRAHCAIAYIGCWTLLDASLLGTFFKVPPIHTIHPIGVGTYLKLGQCKIQITSEGLEGDTTE